MTLKQLNRFLAKLGKFQENTKCSISNSDRVKAEMHNYTKDNENEPIVLMKGINCRFGNLIANQNVTFDLKN
jgi:hypothetical protein